MAMADMAVMEVMDTVMGTNPLRAAPETLVS
jgi:hypothetical protein